MHAINTVPLHRIFWLDSKTKAIAMLYCCNVINYNYITMRNIAAPTSAGLTQPVTIGSYHALNHYWILVNFLVVFLSSYNGTRRTIATRTM